MDDQSVWYIAIDGHQVGPMSMEELAANFRSGTGRKDALVFGPGMKEWKRAADVPELAFLFASGSGGDAPPIPSELDPGECAIAEAGAMMYMTNGIGMEAIFGDGSQKKGGILDALMGAGKRVIIGESLFMTAFQNQAKSGKERVAFAAPYAGKIIPVDLRAIGGELICQKDSFLCAARGVSVGIAFQKKLGAGLFGGEGFIMERLQGDGLCFVHAGGTVHQLELAPGEKLRVDTGCLVALMPSVEYDVEFVGKIKTALFGGEGIFFATLRGPGKVWLQSLPFSRLAGRIVSASGGWRKEEGSVLDRAFGLGRMIDGD